MKTTAELEEEIYQAAREARECGWDVNNRDGFGELHNDRASCCPLAALVMKHGRAECVIDTVAHFGALTTESAAADILGVPAFWVASFEEGVDGCVNRRPNGAWLCGRSVGRRLGFTYDDSWMEPSSEDD